MVFGRIVKPLTEHNPKPRPPDRREWLHLDDPPHLDRVEPFVHRCGRAWECELGNVFLRLTRIGDWVCLDGWKWDRRHPPEQGPEPTEADIPVGFV